MFLSEFNITQDMSLNEFTTILGQIARAIFSGLNRILQIFFNDLKLFNVPIGYISIAVFLLFAIFYTLTGTLGND